MKLARRWKVRGVARNAYYVCTIQCMYIDILISSLSLMNDETNKGGKKKVREETEGFQGGKEIKKKEEKKRERY